MYIKQHPVNLNSVSTATVLAAHDEEFTAVYQALNDKVTATVITEIPLYVGQIAVVAGVGYIATGTSSTSDWKQIT